MFSVVIPLYNKELSITNTVQSVLDQTYQNFEIVIINDGSTDNSIKAVEAINDNRIRLIHQENQGVSAARNRGIKEAKYEWIAFLDGDDLWEPNHLEETTKMMNLYPEEKVFTTSFVYSDSRPIFKHTRQKTIFKVQSYFKEAIDEEIICSSTVAINRVCFDTIGAFNTSITHGEDLELWARLARVYSIIKSCNATAVYRVEAENRSRSNVDVKRNIAFHLNLSNAQSIDEEAYYKTIVLKRLYAHSRHLELKKFFILKRAHQSIGYLEYFLFVFNHIQSRLNYKFNT